jgi:hypothetical protein
MSDRYAVDDPWHRPPQASPVSGRHPVERLWREVGLPEYFLGNDGSNTKLYELYDRIRGDLIEKSIQAIRHCGECDCPRMSVDAIKALGHTQRPAVNPDGINGCMAVAAKALDFLANHERPIYGQQKYNAEHLMQIASELRRTSAALSLSSTERK